MSDLLSIYTSQSEMSSFFIDKMGIFNIKSYGATGNGVADDYTAIMAAHAALPATGGVIYAPYGIYRHTQQLLFTKPVILLGQGHGSNINEVNYGATVFLKDGNFDGIVLKGQASSIRDIQQVGDTGNGGDGIVIKAGRCSIENVSTMQNGGNGLRIGASTLESCNAWRIKDLISLNNTGHGLYIHDPASATLPNANAGLLMGYDARGNGGDGLRVEHAIDNTFLGIMSATNTGYGVHLMSGAKGNKFFAPYVESNTAGEFIFDSGADQNISLGYRSGVASDGYTDNGAGNLILCNDAQQTGNPPYFKSGFSTKGLTIQDNSISGFWTHTQDAANRNLLIKFDGSGATPANVVVSHAQSGIVIWKHDQMSVGGGTIVKKHLRVTGTLDFASIPANSTAEIAIAATGAVAGDSCYAMPSGAPESGLMWSAYAGTDIVTVRVANVTAGAIDPASRSWSVDVWQH